jgi:hypothetical protein
MKTPVSNTQNNQQHIVIIKSENKQPISLITKIKNKMKKLKSIFCICTLAVLITSCEKEDTTAPTNVPSSNTVPDCERYHTARVKFKNRSASNKTLTIIWDGSVKTTIAPSQDSQVFTEAAGHHTLVFKVSNTGEIGCSQSNPVLVECHDQEFTCTY